MLLRTPKRPFSAALATIATGLCCIFLFAGLWIAKDGSLPIAQAIDNKVTDLFFRLRGEIPTSGSVIIVDIDEKSLQEVGQWPWPRDIMAELVDKIALTSPLALGFAMVFAEQDRLSPDLFFSTHRRQLRELGIDLEQEKILRNAFPGHDKLLGEAIRKLSLPDVQGEEQRGVIQGYNFVFREDFQRKTTPAIPKQNPPITLHCNNRQEKCLPSFFHAYRAIVNIPEIATGTSEGFLNTMIDPNGAVRRAPTLITLEQGNEEKEALSYFPSFALEMFRAGQKEEKIDITVLESGGHREDITTKMSTGKKQYRNRPPQRGYSPTGITVLGRHYTTDSRGRLGINFYGGYNTFLYLSACDVLTDNVFLPQSSRIIIGSSAAGIGSSAATPFSPQLPEVELQATLLDNLLQHNTLTLDHQFDFQCNLFMIIISTVLLALALNWLNIITAVLLALSGLAAVCCSSYILFVDAYRPFALSYGTAAYILTFIALMLASYAGEGRQRYLVRQAFSHYVAPSVVQELIKNPGSVNLHADSREVSIMFCDIRRFSSIAERLPPETLSSMLNNYFTLLTDIILKHKGTIDKYIGDSIMAVWGSPLHDSDHALHAVEAALEMVETIEKNPTIFEEEITIGIGINSGMVSAGNFGSEKRFDYTVFGDNVNIAARVEQETKRYSTSLLITEHTRKRLPPAFPCTYIDTVQVRGRNGETQLFAPERKEKTGLPTKQFTNIDEIFKS